MNFRPFAHAAMLAAGLLALTSASAYEYDKYGRQIYTPGDWVRDNAANTKSLNDSSRAFQAEANERMANWQREVAEREAYNSPEAVAARRQARAAAAAEWQEKVDFERAERIYQKEKKEAARLADIERGKQVVLGFIKKFADEQRSITKVILLAGPEITGPVRDSRTNADVVAGFAEGLITGSFRDLSLADLQITLSPEERWVEALKLYGDANFFGEHYGHGENHNLLNGRSPDAFFPDLIAPAALLLGGHGYYVLRNIREVYYIAEPNRALTIGAGLAAALAMPASDLSVAQRQQALALLVALIPMLELRGDDGVALAALLVAAAQKNPELAAVKSVQDQLVPLVRDSIWARGFKSVEVSPTERKLADLPPITPTYWNLASMMTLAKASDAPMIWFVRGGAGDTRRRLCPDQGSGLDGADGQCASRPRQ